MQALSIANTQSTPSIYFDQAANVMIMKGESFPENAAKFYAPAMEWLQEYLSTLGTEKAVMQFEIIYFNSSTSKIFMTILDMLQAEVEKGKNISVLWLCDAENETAIECGEEFKEDLNCLSFEIVLV
ncbi:MAG: DUF1987 domain-containing protein [Eubacteriales bacterium]|nr:DUF1987 domain-containing protein [Eubacteriales bacterium]